AEVGSDHDEVDDPVAVIVDEDVELVHRLIRGPAVGIDHEHQAPVRVRAAERRARKHLDPHVADVIRVAAVVVIVDAPSVEIRGTAVDATLARPTNESPTRAVSDAQRRCAQRRARCCRVSPDWPTAFVRRLPPRPPSAGRASIPYRAACVSQLPAERPRAPIPLRPAAVLMAEKPLRLPPRTSRARPNAPEAQRRSAPRRRSDAPAESRWIQ